jgi:hypothetical protein
MRGGYVVAVIVTALTGGERSGDSTATIIARSSHLLKF